MLKWLVNLENRINAKLKYINLRQLLGIIIFVLGVLLVIGALYGFAQIAHAESTTSSAEKWFEHNPTWNPVIKFFGGSVQKKISSYYGPMTAALIIGILLAFAGAFIYKRCRKR